MLLSDSLLAYPETILQSVNLTSAVEKGDLVVVDLFTMNTTASSVTEQGTPGPWHLTALYQTLEGHITGSNRETLLLIDDIAHWEWMGYDQHRILIFLRSLQALCRKVSGPSFIFHHLLTFGIY